MSEGCEVCKVRQELVETYGEDDVYTTEEMTAKFEVTGFMAPYVGVRRRSDGVKGSFQFTHSPRYYFGWQESV